MPVGLLTVNGSGVSTPWIPDVKQNPFNIGIGVTVGTGSLGTAILSVEHCFDFATVMLPTWDGSTLVQWFPNTGINATTVTFGTGINGNYAFGVAAIRLNVASAASNATIIANLIQSENSP